MGKVVKAHRVAAALKFGMFDQTLEVCHRCDNPSCVNPDHLFLDTHYGNMMDAKSKNRWPNQSKTHCKNNHKFSEENTYIAPDGHRECRSCRAAASRKHYRKKG